MIKVGTFLFEEHGFTDLWAKFALFGTLKFVDIQFYSEISEVDLGLKAGCAYQISFDQSTSNTGMFIKSLDNTEAYMVEMRKDSGVGPDDYIFMLEMLIHKICGDIAATHLIYERPIKTENYRSSQVLFQLEGMIRALPRRYSEFKAARLDSIENPSWRRVAILPQFKNYERKVASEQSIKEIYPWSCHYGNSIGKDRDIFEAMGTMFGWFFNSFDHLGRPYVRGDRFYGNIGCFILPGVSAQSVADELRKAGLDSVWAMQNPRKSIYENIACAVEKYKVVCVEFSDPHTMLALTVEANMKWLAPDKLTVVMVTANYVDSALFKITGNEYHFVI